MPVLNMHDDHGGYRTLIEKTFKPMLEEHEKQLGSNTVPNGKLAVIYDKNKMETSGYAATSKFCCFRANFLVMKL